MKDNYINWIVKNRNNRIELKEKDLKLSNLIKFNSRISLVKLAKQLKISKVAVFNRLKNLEDKEIVTGYSCLINFSKLGYKIYQLAIKTSMTIKQKQEYLDKINNLEFVNSILKLTSSKWDFLIRIISTETQLNNHINQISDNYIVDLNIMQVVKIDYSYEETKEMISIDMLYENNKLSISELRLLYELAKNSKQKIVDLASKLNKSPKTIIQTIIKLQKNNIIVSFPVQFNPFIYGNEAYTLLITTKNRLIEKNITKNLVKLNSQGALLNLQNPNIISFHTISSLDDLKKIEKTLQPFADDILNYEFIKVEEQSLYHFFPKEVYEELIEK